MPAIATIEELKSVQMDIDNFKAAEPTAFKAMADAVKQAYEKAKKDTGLDIPLSQAGVADAPYNFEDRLIMRIPD